MASWRSYLKRIFDPLFWVPFIFIIILKLGIFNYAATRYLLYGYHVSFGDFAIVESFADFTFYYLRFVTLFVQGHLPYTETLMTIEGVQVYIYTPLFLYITTFFNFLPTEYLFPNILILNSGIGANLSFLRIGFAFVFFDIITAATVYIAAKTLSSNRAIPIGAMLLFALNPIALWWGDYMWLSTPIHTFFLVLGFVYMLRGQLRWGAFWVAIATMVKQTAGLLLPVILFLELARGKKRFLTSLVIMLGVGILSSMPYLVLYPGDYLSSVTRGMGAWWLGGELPQNTYPVPLAVLAFYWPEPVRTFVIYTLFYGIPFGAFLAVFWASAWVINQKDTRVFHQQLVTLALLLSLALHTFWARGIYKYYLIALLPFLILFGVIYSEPLIPTPIRLTTLQTRPITTSTYFQRIANRMRLGLNQFRTKALVIINNKATWWMLLVWVASVGIYGLHRLIYPAILFWMFIGILFFAWYTYMFKDWLRQRTQPTSPPEESTSNDLEVKE